MDNQDVVLISAPNVAGEQYMKLLKKKEIPFAAIVNSTSEYKRIAALGAKHIIVVNTTKEDSWIIPEVEIGKVYLFERSVNLCADMPKYAGAGLLNPSMSLPEATIHGTFTRG